LDRKIGLVSGCFGENDGGPNSAEDGLSVILFPSVLDNVYDFAFLENNYVVALLVLEQGIWICLNFE